MPAIGLVELLSLRVVQFKISGIGTYSLAQHYAWNMYVYEDLRDYR